jgi:hypothetical protein
LNVLFCSGRAGYVRDPETQMADKAAGGTELTKVCRGIMQSFAERPSMLLWHITQGKGQEKELTQADVVCVALQCLNW